MKKLLLLGLLLVGCASTPSRKAADCQTVVDCIVFCDNRKELPEITFVLEHYGLRYEACGCVADPARNQSHNPRIK